MVVAVEEASPVLAVAAVVVAVETVGGGGGDVEKVVVGVEVAVLSVDVAPVVAVEGVDVAVVFVVDDAVPELFGSTTRTVRVASPTFPPASITRYVIVCSAGNEVSMVTSEAARPSTKYVMPRFTSAAGLLIMAPRSAYVAPTFIVAGLLPCISSTGAFAFVVEVVPAVAVCEECATLRSALTSLLDMH